jgi:hypothetical protein
MVQFSDVDCIWAFSWLICVQKSNGTAFKWHLNTGQTCPFFKWSLSLAYVLWSENWSGFQMVKKRWPILPFENWTQIVSRK